MLLSGRTAEEIYQQLNSRNANSGAHLLDEACGPTSSAPYGLRPRSPCSAGVYTRTSNTSQANQCRDEAYTGIATDTHVVTGVPFAYEDCDRLKQTADQFSLLIQPAIAKSVQLSAGGQAWAAPAQWHQNGVRTSLVNGREWAVDVIVF
jgi:hypothetical protein